MPTTTKMGSRTATREEPRVHEFINSSNLPLERLRAMVVFFLNNQELIRMVLGLTPEDQERFVHRVDQVLPTVGTETVGLVAALGTASSATGILPGSAVLSDEGLKTCGNVPVISTGLVEVWLGERGHGGVFIVAFPNYSAQDLKEAKKIIWKEAVMWKRLSHDNVLPFHGVDVTLFQLALVYGRGENGNIIQYVTSHPKASRTRLLLEVVRGLQYLHSLGVHHGGLRGRTVHVDGSGHARLTEYGLAPLSYHPILTAAATPDAVEGPLAPELIHPTIGSDADFGPADVFAFAMLAYEVLTGKPPFNGQSRAMAALLTSQGDRPEFPENGGDTGLTAQMQDLLQRCWRHNPMERPTIDEVVETLELLDKIKESQVTNPEPPIARSLMADTQVRPKRPTWRKWFCGLGLA